MSIRSRCVIAVTVFACMYFGSAGPVWSAEAPDKTLNLLEMLAQMAEERESRVKTFQGTYTWIDRSGPPGGPLEVNGQREISFITSGSKVRSDMKAVLGPDVQHEYSSEAIEIFDGENWLDYLPRAKHAMYRKEGSLDFSPLQHGVRPFPMWPLSRYLRRIAEKAKTEEPGSVTVTGPEIIDGTPHYTIHLIYDDPMGRGTGTYLIDAGRGLIRRYEQLNETVGHICVREIKRKEEVAPGLWYPVEFTVTITDYEESPEGKRIPTHISQRTVIAKEIEVNKPIPDERFKVVFPPGTWVGSDITGTGFRIPKLEGMAEDLAERKAEEEKLPTPEVTPPPTPTEETRPVVTQPSGETSPATATGPAVATSPALWPYTALGIAIVLVIAGLIVLLLKRRRATGG